MSLSPWTIIAVAALLAMAGAQGYKLGHDAADNKHQDTLLAEIEAAQILDAERRRVARERDDLAKQLEEQAYAEPISVKHCISPSRVRRLNAISQRD